MPASKTRTSWKVSVFGVILVRIFPHSDWLFSPNTFGLSIQSEYIRTEYSVRIGENVDQNDSKYGQFLHSGVNSLRAVFTNLANIYDGAFLF